MISTRAYLAVLFLFFCFSVLSQNQTPLDSLKSLLPESKGTDRIDIKCKMARQLLYVSHQEAQAMIDEVVKESSELDYQDGLCEIQMVQGTLFLFQSRFSEAEETFNEAIAFAERIQHEVALAYGKLGLGALYINQGKLALAYENHIEGLKFASAINNADLELTYLMNIGVIKQLLEEFDEALVYLLQAKDLAEANKLNQRLGQIYGNLGIIEVKRNNFGLSIGYQQSAIKYFEMVNARTHSAVSYQNIGFSYTRLAEYKEAEAAYDKSLSIRLETGDTLGYARGLRYKGELFMEKGELRKAQDFFSTALRIALDYDNQVLLSEIYELQFKTYEKQAAYREALEAHKYFVTIKDSMTSRTNKEKVAELTAAFELEKLEAENRLQSSESELKDLKIKQRNQLLVAAVILIVVVVVWAIWKRGQLRTQLLIKEKDHTIAQKEAQLRAIEFESEKLKLKEYASQLLSKNEELETMISSSKEDMEEVDGLIEKLKFTIHDEKDWTSFRLYFDTLFPAFFDRLKDRAGFELTINEQRLLSLIKIALSNKEIGGILNISRNSVVRAKYRLRQKFQFAESKEFEEFIVKL